MPRIIEVTVSPQGRSHDPNQRLRGDDCLQASKFLEDALGITSADRKTAEYYQSAPSEQHIQQ